MRKEADEAIKATLEVLKETQTNETPSAQTDVEPEPESEKETKLEMGVREKPKREEKPKMPWNVYVKLSLSWL